MIPISESLRITQFSKILFFLSIANPVVLFLYHQHSWLKNSSSEGVIRNLLIALTFPLRNHLMEHSLRGKQRFDFVCTKIYCNPPWSKQNPSLLLYRPTPWRCVSFTQSKIEILSFRGIWKSETVMYWRSKKVHGIHAERGVTVHGLYMGGATPLPLSTTSIFW